MGNYSAATMPTKTRGHLDLGANRVFFKSARSACASVHFNYGKYNWPLNSMGLNCMRSLTSEFFSNISEIHDHWKKFIVRIQYLIHITYKMYVEPLFMLLVWLLVNSGLLVVKFWGSQKLHTDSWLCRETVPLTSTLFKGQMLHSFCLIDKSRILG